MFVITAFSVTITAQNLWKAALNSGLLPEFSNLKHFVFIESARANRGCQYEHESDSFSGGTMPVNGLS